MSDLILVTGGAGTLGRAVVPFLLEGGFRVRLLDLRPVDDLPVGVDMVVGDLRAMGDVEAAITGAVGVLHAAAWHGMHLRDHARGDFWDLNVSGTYNVYEAATAAGVRAIVYSSTMGVYGATQPPEGEPAIRISEDLPRRPGDVYGLSKAIGEDMSEAYARMSGIGGASLRYGMFVPEPFDHAGIRFLYGGVDARDVARANVIALQRLLRDGGHLGAFNVFSQLPFDAADGYALRADPVTAIRRHWPDGPALLEARGVAPWGPIDQVYEIARAEAILGFRPQHGFEQYLDALRSGRDAL